MAYVKESWTDGSGNAIDAASLSHLETQYDGVMAEAVSAPTPSKIVYRDANGRSQVAAPAVAADIATKGYVDGAVSGLAPLASPALTGNPTAPTPAPGDADTSVATTAFVAAANGLLIPKALVTAKGDLIGASGNGTPVNVPVGTNGQVLTADSTQAAGMKWAGIAAGVQVVAMPKVGGKFGPTFPVGNTASNNTQFDNVYRVAHGYAIPFPISIDQLCVEVGAADAACHAFVAVWAPDVNGLPGALLGEYDLGAVAATGRQVLTLTTPLALPAGIVWAAFATSVGVGSTTAKFTNAGGALENLVHPAGTTAWSIGASVYWEIAKPDNSTRMPAGQAGPAGWVFGQPSGGIWIGMRRSA